MGSVRGNETNLSLKKRKRGGVEICLLDVILVGKDLISILEQLNLEYFILIDNKEVYSKNYKKIIKNEIKDKIFKYKNFYYEKVVKDIILDKVKYKIEYLENISKYINTIIELKNDKLTGLKTRTDLENYLLFLNKKSIFVLCDLDDFKDINDTYGHQVGDEVLKLFGRIIKENISNNDYAARYGGEEFLIIFNNDNIKKVKSIIYKINQELIRKSKKMHISFSAGIAIYNNDKKISDTIRKADLALYYVKNNGKNGYYEYNSDLEKRFIKEVSEEFYDKY